MGNWLRSKTGELFLPAVAVAEIEQGICKLRRGGGHARAADLTRWLDELMLAYGSQILAFDAAAARLAGQIADKAMAAGRHPGFPDIAVAAIAGQNGLTVLTRNVRHFATSGVPCLDPFRRLPQ